MRIKLDNFSYGYKEGFSLNSVSLEIKDGEKIAIMGSNGSGKTTLLNSLAGLYKPDEGKLLVDSKDILNTKNGAKSYWKNLSYLIQFPERQIFASTLYDEIAYPMKARGFKKSDVDNAVVEILKKVGLESVAKDTNPFTLSGGQRRKLALASALAYSPALVLLDEPLSGLDGYSKKEIISLLEGLDSTAVVMVTHDVLSALKMERLIILDGGRIIYDGNSSVLLKKEECSKLGIELSDVAKINCYFDEIGKDCFKSFIEEIVYG